MDAWITGTVGSWFGAERVPYGLVYGKNPIRSANFPDFIVSAKVILESPPPPPPPPPLTFRCWSRTWNLGKLKLFSKLTTIYFFFKDFIPHIYIYIILTWLEYVGVITPNQIPLTTIVTYLQKSYRSRISNHWATIPACSVVPPIYKKLVVTLLEVSEKEEG